MNPLKLRRMKVLAEALKSVDKSAAWDLISMIEAYEQPPNPRAEMLRESLPHALEVVSKYLKPYHWCLAGGMALLHWVNTRVTYDVDVVVLADDLEKAKASLTTPIAAGNLGFSTQINGVDVDFLDSSLWPYAKEAVEKAVTVSTSGMTLPVMLPEYLVMFKLDSMREKDNQDAFALLRLHGVPQKVRALVKRFRPEMVDDLESAISIAELM